MLLISLVTTTKQYSYDISCFFQWSGKQLGFVIYRGIVFVYSLAYICYAFLFVYTINDFIYLSVLTYILQILFFGMGYFIAFAKLDFVGKNINLQLRPKSDVSRLPWYMSVFWLLSDICQTVPFIITILYFTFVKKSSFHIDGPLSFSAINLHIVNSIIILIDIAVSARPHNLLHFVYVELYALVYVIFMIIFWLVDPQSNIIYESYTDFSHPLRPILYIIIVMTLVIPITQILVFALVSFRLYIYSKIVK